MQKNLNKSVPYVNKRKWLSRYQDEISKRYRDGSSWETIVKFLQDSYDMPFTINEKDFFKYCDFLLEDSDFRYLEQIRHLEEKILALKKNIEDLEEEREITQDSQDEYIFKYQHYKGKFYELEKKYNEDIARLTRSRDKQEQLYIDAEVDAQNLRKDLLLEKQHYEELVVDYKELRKESKRQKHDISSLSSGYDKLYQENYKLLEKNNFLNKVVLVAIFFGFLILLLDYFSVI